MVIFAISVILSPLPEEKRKCMLYSLENQSHFAAGSMAEVQVAPGSNVELHICRVWMLKQEQ